MRGSKNQGEVKMAFRPKDQIDTMLINKYVDSRADNDDLVSMVNPNEMMSAMKDFSEMQRNFMTMNAKLKSLCSAVSSKAASYRASEFPQATPQY